MLKAFVSNRFLFFFLFAAILLRLVALNESWVERGYTFGFYAAISGGLRRLFGWVPFSIGDVLYILFILWIFKKMGKLIVLLRQKRAKAHFTWRLLCNYLKLALLVYIVFLLSWGLNYYRKGIAAQLSLQVQTYSVQDLFDLTLLLQQRLNGYAEKVDSLRRLRYTHNGFLFQQGAAAYRHAQPLYPFLQYRYASIKPSLFTPVGQFIGFTGYYNPFTGEAQLKTDIPVFLKPFVVSHEIAHQVGYAKENEASFVGYLTCKASADVYLNYSAYFDLYREAVLQCLQTPNKLLTDRLRKNIHPRVRYDALELRRYLLRNQNFIEPLMSGAYDRYLKLNNQPHGKATYNEVIAYLVAYMKKYGKAAI